MRNNIQTKSHAILLAAGAALLLAGCSPSPQSTTEPPKGASPQPAAQPAPAQPAVPKLYKVRFDTSKGAFLVEVHTDWAPLGSQRFYELVKDSYFNGARFFRVLPGFVVQFGLAANPASTRKWDKAIADDPVMQTNKPGTVVFATAGPNTRTTQLFINLGRNQALDSQGFAPFGEVTEGMDVVQQIYSGYGEQPDQGQITSRGNTYLEASFPKLDYIRKTALTE